MSHLVRRRVLAALLATAATPLVVAPTAHAAGPLTVTSRVDEGQRYSNGPVGHRVAVADLNGDGVDDHALATPNLVTVYFGARGSVDGGGTLKLTGPFGGDGNVAVESAGDPDGDGFDDLIITPQIGATKAFLLYGAASNPASLPATTAGARVTVITTGSWGPQFSHATGIGDFNGDGKDDLVVPSTTGTGFSDGVSSVAVIAGGPRVANLSSKAAGGRVSLLTGYRSCSTGFIIYFPYFRTTCRAPDPDVVPIGDFNGDGKTDLYVNAKQGASQSIVFGRSAGGFSIPAITPGTGSTNLSSLASNPGLEGFWTSVHAVGDVDRDGFDDFSIPVGTGGQTAVVRGRTNPPSALAATDPVLRVEAAPGRTATIFGTAGDQTGDGRPDLVIASSDTPYWAQGELATASLPAGASSFTRANQTTISGAPAPALYGFSVATQPGDLDGDGSADVAMADQESLIRLTHTGAAVKPRLQVTARIEDDRGITPAVATTVTLTCPGGVQTQTGTTYTTFTFGTDGSLATGDRCTVKLAQTLPTEGTWSTCIWSTSAAFRGAPVTPEATFTVGGEPNLYTQRFLCKQPVVEPEPSDLPTTFDGWRESGGAKGAGEVLRLTSGPNQTTSAVWPKPLNLTGKTFRFTATMSGGNGAAEGLTLAFLSNVGGQPSGLLGAGGGQLGFGGLSGSAVAFDAFKQAEDAQPNTVSFVDGTNGTSLRKLYTKDAGVNMRGKAITWTVSVGTDGKIRLAHGRGVAHEITATLPDSVFLAFTASTSAVWQNQQVAGLRW